MATKKDKLIENIQKLVTKGQFDKAVLEYQQLLAIEPGSINNRQKLAELLIRLNRNDEARAEFETIGKHYSTNGFYLKAIAVYKQLQKISPDDINITICLAELNEKHGLSGNALSEYKRAYDYYEKAGLAAESIKILNAMQLLDPQNVNIRLKLAESLYQSGKKDESFDAFTSLLSVLQEKGDPETWRRLNVRIQELFPDSQSGILDKLDAQIESGDAQSAVNTLQSMLRQDSTNERVWELVIKGLLQLCQPAKAVIASQHFIKFCPASISAMSCLVETLAARSETLKAAETLASQAKSFAAAGAGEKVSDLARSLINQDPANQELLERLSSIATAISDSSLTKEISERIELLKAPLEIEAVEEEEESLLPELLLSGEENQPESSMEEPETLLELPEEAASELAADLEDPEEVDVEIEIDIDDDFLLDVDQDLAEEPAPLSGDSLGDDWLGSVDQIMSSISAEPGKVRFDPATGVDSIDYQAHYDLGIAFKEMGLYDEAINELRQCAQDPGRRIESIVLQAVCLREKGDLETAENLLQTIHLNPSLELDDSCLAAYELSNLYEMVGRHDEAVALLEEINLKIPGFRDVGTRLDMASSGQKGLDFSDDELDDFELV